MAYQYVYVMKGVSKAWPGGKTVLENIHLSFFPGAKIGVIGPNGAGKSTLLRIMAGLDTDYTGEAWPAKEAKVGYLPQEPELDSSKDVAGNVMEGLAEAKQLVDRFNEVSMKLGEVEDPDEMNELIQEQAELQEKIDAKDAWDLERDVEIAMDALRCPPGDWPVERLSGGEKRRVALARLLLAKPDLLLLDEPTNHLDAESVAWLERHLQSYHGTIVLVTHDRYFLDNVCGWILELDRGRGIPFEGNYSQWLADKEKRLEREKSQEQTRQKTLSRELEWIKSNQKGQQSKSKARIKAYDELLKEHQQQNKQPGTAQIVIPTPPRLGDEVITAEQVRKGFGNVLLMDELSFKLPPGALVGIIGPNGAGKTTLFRMITGHESPDAGEIRVGETVELGYIDQTRESLSADKTVFEEIAQGEAELDMGRRKVNARAYVGSFNFKGPDQQKKVGQLSGGERNRVHLAKMLRTGANTLLLDEPTNDLDVDTLRALEEALLEFPGCALITSHDRFFLDRIATHIIAFEGDSQVTFFEGNFQEYEADKRRRLGDEATQPKRIKYKPISR